MVARLGLNPPAEILADTCSAACDCMPGRTWLKTFTVAIEVWLSRSSSVKAKKRAELEKQLEEQKAEDSKEDAA